MQEKLKQLNFQKVQLDTGSFLQVLSLVNSCLTGMQLDSQVDYIAMTFLLGVSRSIYTTGSKSKMEEHLCDHLRDHSVWNDVNFWDQHFFDVVGKAFKKKFVGKSLSDALSGGWSDEHLKFLSQFTASFGHEMTRWSLAEESVGTFLAAVYDRLQIPQRYQDVTKAYFDKLVTTHNTKAVADSQRMRHVSMVMSTAQAARIMGNLKAATGAGTPKMSHDTNILQGWLKRKVHVMWISEWVDQVGLHLNFREFKQGTNKRIVINLNQITKVEVRSNDATLKDSRTIYIEAGDVKVTVAPVKDTQEEIDYWVNGLKRMQGRFNVSPGTRRVESGRVPKVDPATRRSAVPASLSGTLPQAARTEGTLKLLASKELAPSFGMSAPGWTGPVSCTLNEPKLVFKRGESVLASIDLQDMTHMPEVDGKVIRLHTKQGAHELSEFDPPETQEKWLKALTAFKKKKSSAAAEAPAATAAVSVAPPVLQVNAVAASASAPVIVEAHTYKMGDMVWCEFVEDKLWYRGVIYYLSGDSYKIVFIEYGNTQDSGPKQVRPIDDAAMLALAGKDLAYVLSPKSIDAARPLTVQLPQAIVQDLRRGTRAGTIMRLDPKAILQQLKEERGDDEEAAAAAAHEASPAPQRHALTAPVISGPPAVVKKEETEPDLFDWALHDDDEVDEAELLEADEAEPEAEEQVEVEGEGETEAPVENKRVELKARLASRRMSSATERLAPEASSTPVDEEARSPRKQTAVAALAAVRARTSTAEGASAAAARVKERLEQRRREKEENLLKEDDDDE